MIRRIKPKRMDYLEKGAKFNDRIVYVIFVAIVLLFVCLIAFVGR